MMSIHLKTCMIHPPTPEPVGVGDILLVRYLRFLLQWALRSYLHSDQEDERIDDDDDDDHDDDDHDDW